MANEDRRPVVFAGIRGEREVRPGRAFASVAHDGGHARTQAQVRSTRGGKPERRSYQKSVKELHVSPPKTDVCEAVEAVRGREDASGGAPFEAGGSKKWPKVWTQEAEDLCVPTVVPHSPRFHLMPWSRDSGSRIERQWLQSPEFTCHFSENRTRCRWESNQLLTLFSRNSSAVRRTPRLLSDCSMPFWIWQILLRHWLETCPTEIHSGHLPRDAAANALDLPAFGDKSGPAPCVKLGNMR